MKVFAETSEFFYISIILSQLTFYGIIDLAPMLHIFRYYSCIGLFIFFGCYITLALDPLRTFLFKDPINGKYGFRAHFHKSSKSRK